MAELRDLPEDAFAWLEELVVAFSTPEVAALAAVDDDAAFFRSAFLLRALTIAGMRKAVHGGSTAFTAEDFGHELGAAMRDAAKVMARFITTPAHQRPLLPPGTLTRVPAELH